MKNHILFKFIAVILCAAALLGVVGGTAGVIALTQGDLYNKTVDEVRQERIQEWGSEFAYTAARVYESRTLGGCPDAMLEQMYNWNTVLHTSYWISPWNYGYEILDAEGKVLDSYQTEWASSGETYSFPVTGKYAHLVSTTTQTERDARMNAVSTEEKLVWSISSIPESGAAVHRAVFSDAQNSVILNASGAEYLDGDTGHMVFNDPETFETTGTSLSAGPVGTVHNDINGNVVFLSTFALDEELLHGQIAVAHAALMDADGEILYEAYDPEGVGTLSISDTSVTFVGQPVAQEPEETAEPLVEETMVGAEETVAPTAAEEETAPVETYWEEQEDGSWIALPVTQEEETREEDWEPDTQSDEDGEEWYEDGESQDGEDDAQVQSEEETDDWQDEETTDPENEENTAEEETIATEAAAEETAPTQTVPEETVPEETAPEETVPEETEPVFINGKALSQYERNTVEYYYDGETVYAEYVWVPMEDITVRLYLGANALRDEGFYTLLRAVREIRGLLLPTIGISLLILAILAVYLCTAAGRKPKTDEIRAGGLNRMPLDLYGGIVIAGVVALIALAYLSIEENLLRYNFAVGCAGMAAAAYAACLLVVGFFFALAAQLKMSGNFWWTNSLCGRILHLCVRFAIWLEQLLGLKALPFLGRSGKSFWASLRRGASNLSRWMGRSINRFLNYLPLTWQWLVAGLAIIFLSALLINSYSILLILLGILLPLAIVLYGAHCFGALFDSTKRMSKGDLDTKVDDSRMVGCFREFAGDLNNLADVAVVAAQKQLKSERMKTELITNVSHDIKTPLTSIINYVDLLQKPHTDAEEAQYLEVLDRQSQRLKKLIDDLMDMSKASTGNMTVEIVQVDAVESVNQALGEFADKLDRAQLFPVFRHEEDRVPMMADGRLVWRVLSNLLSNAVKYAMPGTRLYIDLMQMEGKVLISLKNISRDELNVDADELMERFVRGDDSRNTEGSGLGLNIAKSLMELQKGQLQLLVDGDLFKVTLIFPGI